MKRRYDLVVPPGLITFDGRRCRTMAEYEAGTDAFHAARAQWAAERGLSEDALPDWKYLGDCPWDPDAI